MMSKMCRRCHIEKPYDCFYKDKAIKDGRHQWCKTCKKQSRKDWRQSEVNRQKDREAAKRQRLKNPNDRRRRYLKTKQEKPGYYANAAKISRQRRGEVFRIHRRFYDKQRRANDPLYKIRRATSNLITNAIKYKYNKKSKVSELLCIDWLSFKTHIENQFITHMTWNNYGLWHLDHICPCSQARDEKELHTLQHYSNLRPIWANENLTKSDLKTADAELMCRKILKREWAYE
jgi:hypothetical protein